MDFKVGDIVRDKFWNEIGTIVSIKKDVVHIKKFPSGDVYTHTKDIEKVDVEFNWRNKNEHR